MSRAAPGPVDYLLLVTLGFIWGSAFLLSKIAVADFPPVTITLIRQLVSGALLIVMALVMGALWFRPSGRDHVFMIICGATGVVIPFTLINWGVMVVDSGLAAILMGLMPLVVLVLAHVLTRDEKLTLPKTAGVGVGLAGLVVLFWPALVSGFGQDVWRQLALLGAAVSYGVSALSMKQLVRHPPLTLMTYITGWTLVVLVPLTLWLDGSFDVTPTRESVLALLGLGVFPSAVGALLMFALIERQGASFFGQINLIVPVAGVLVGVAIAGERLEPTAFIALAIIVSGLAIARLRTGAPTPLVNESPKP